MKKTLDKETVAREASFWTMLKQAAQVPPGKTCRK